MACDNGTCIVAPNSCNDETLPNWVKEDQQKSYGQQVTLLDRKPKTAGESFEYLRKNSSAGCWYSCKTDYVRIENGN
jgi:hypothetical protein